MAKVYYLIMAAMSLIVFGFAIAGTADYFIRQKISAANGSFSDTKLGLWRFKTQSKDADGNLVSSSSTKIHGGSDEAQLFRDFTTCGGFVDHVKAATAFAIMTCIFAFVALIGFVLNITGNEVPLGFIGAILTIVCSLITWAIMAAIRNRKHCKDKIFFGVDASINLDDKNKQDPIFHFYNGFYFFLIPWILFVLAFIVAIVLKAGDKEENEDDNQKESSNEPASASSEEKSRSTTTTTTTTTTSTVIVKKEKKADERSEADKEQEEKEKADRAAAQKKESEEKRKQEEKAAAEEEKKAKAEEAEMAVKLNKDDVERRKKIWADLKHRLPVEKKDKEQRSRRFELFAQFDSGNKKYLTPAELESCCKTELGLGQLKKGLAHILPKAHSNARTVHSNQGQTHKQSAEQIRRDEFRLTLSFTKDLFDLWFIFDEINVSNSGAITSEEFTKGFPTLKKKFSGKTEAKAEFTTADAKKTGEIDFDEFCNWAGGDAHADEGVDTDADEKSDELNAEEQRKLNHDDVERRRKIWEGLKPNLPTNKASKEERARRFQYFRDFDTAKKGHLTLADVEEGCATVLGLGQLGKGLHHILPLAHNSARGLTSRPNADNSAASDEHVEKSEMRMLFVYIHQYFDLWFLFDTLDTGNNGEIDLEEFKSGIPAVEKWAGVKINDVEKEFRLADSGEGAAGEISFVEFVEWAHSKNSKDE